MKILLFWIVLAYSAFASAGVKEPAKAVLIFDYTSNTITEQSNIHVSFPIASVTKLMTVYTVLESRADLDQLITIEKQQLEKSHVLRPGMKVTRKELISMSLIASDNLAAKTLALAHPTGYSDFLALMNANAFKLGMFQTNYIDPTGLLLNVSSAWDLHLLNRAVSKYSVFNESAMSKHANADALNKKGLVQRFMIHNTNAFAGEYNIQVGKTGFTNPAGWCISMLIKHKNRDFDIIVLGSPNKQTRNKLTEQHLKNYMNFITRLDVVNRIGTLDSYSDEN